MKRIIFFFVFILLAQLSFASPNVTIRNVSSCNVYIMLSYSNDMNNPCLQYGYSSVISVAAGATLYYDFYAAPAPGVGPIGYGFFNGVRILTGPVACSPGTYNIGNPCIFPSQAASFLGRDAFCQPCANISAGWTFSTGPTPDVVELKIY
jgi:hypothetical protein